MSPIFVRPVREQLEHDRLIRHLQGKFKRKFEVAANVGDEQVAQLKVGSATLYPDLVLTSGQKVAGVIEVETGESVNNLEAMAEWVPFAKAKAPFSLYVPVTAYDATRRLCAQFAAAVSEIWTYRGAMDGFDLVRMFHDANAAATAARATRAAARASAAKSPGVRKTAKRPAATRPVKTAGGATTKARSVRKARPSATSASSSRAPRKQARARGARATKTARAGARKK